MNVVIDHWPLVLMGAVVALILLYFLLRPRQRVSLTDSGPIRPHMAARSAAADGSAGTAAGVSRLIEPMASPSGPADDLVRLKGIGPKLATLLNAQGITRFDQIAKLTPQQVADLDERLGAFRGRLARDHVVNQADYLARGDIDGFEQRFGKL